MGYPHSCSDKHSVDDEFAAVVERSESVVSVSEIRGAVGHVGAVFRSCLLERETEQCPSEVWYQFGSELDGYLFSEFGDESLSYDRCCPVYRDTCQKVCCCVVEPVGCQSIHDTVLELVSVSITEVGPIPQMPANIGFLYYRTGIGSGSGNLIDYPFRSIGSHTVYLDSGFRSCLSASFFAR